MLSKFVALPVDELYVNIAEDNDVVRIGVNSGVIIEDELFPSKAMCPKTCVRTVASLANIPLILSLKSSYPVDIEICSPQLAYGASRVRDLVIRTRNGHRSLGEHYPLGYRKLEEADYYSVGLVYHTLTKKLCLPEHQFKQQDLDLSIDRQYVDNALERHVMAEHFGKEHVVDFCSVLIDPRIHMGPEGKFRYSGLSRLLGFGSIELACQLTRKFTELHGSGPLPYDPKTLTQILQKVTGSTYGKGVGHPIQLLGVRILHGLLNTPLDDLSVSLNSAGSTRLARDAEIVRQQLFSLVNVWMEKLYGTSWTADTYSPAEFEDIREDD